MTHQDRHRLWGPPQLSVIPSCVALGEASSLPSLSFLLFKTEEIILKLYVVLSSKDNGGNELNSGPTVVGTQNLEPLLIRNKTVHMLFMI